MSNLERKIQIVYKSGHTVTAWFKIFEVTQQGGDLKKVEWELSPRETIRFYYLGIDNVESIIRIDEREVVEDV